MKTTLGFLNKIEKKVIKSLFEQRRDRVYNQMLERK